MGVSANQRPFQRAGSFCRPWHRADEQARGRNEVGDGHVHRPMVERSARPWRRRQRTRIVRLNVGDDGSLRPLWFIQPRAWGDESK